MNAKTLEALKGSIKKWEGIVAGNKEDKRIDNCDLCQTFPECLNCPVELFTKYSNCSFTPYQVWAGYQVDSKKSIWVVFDEKSKELAQAEVDFLKSLLSEGE